MHRGISSFAAFILQELIRREESAPLHCSLYSTLAKEHTQKPASYDVYRTARCMPLYTVGNQWHSPKLFAPYSILA